jgi:hypothetical protein
MGKVHAFQKLLFCGGLGLITDCQFCHVLMEQKTWSVQFVMEDSDSSVQNAEKPMKNKRSQADKVGKHKYELQRLNRIEKRLDSIDRKLDRIEFGIKPSLVYKKGDIEEIACKDEVDKEILQALFEAGSPGLLPKDIAMKLTRFKITRHHVSRRLGRMNQRLQKRLNEAVAEQRGWHWALTSFALNAYGDGGVEFSDNGHSDGLGTEEEAWK